MNGSACPSCGTPAAPLARYCVRCGTSLAQAEPATGAKPGALTGAPAAPYPGPIPAYPLPPGAVPYPVPAAAFPGYWVPARPRTSGLGVTALVLGIVSFAFWILGFVTAPLALALGAAGRRRIDADPGRWGGKGMATAGLALGAVWMGLATLIIGGLVLARLLGSG